MAKQQSQAKPAGTRMTPGRARRESKRARLARTGEILGRLKEEYPDAQTALDHRDPLQLLVATILSAQCTDKRVNMVTPDLFRRYPTARHYGDAELSELEEMIRSTGFFRNKAKSLKALGQTLVEKHDGRVPGTMAELTRLPGVGRKTANVTPMWVVCRESWR
jgi:endonuclease-3